MDVVAWLRGLGLEQYAPAFGDNDADDEVLPQRRKLLAAIAALSKEPPTPIATSVLS